MELSALTNDTDAQQFVLTVDGHTAFIDYEIIDGVYHLKYSEVPKPLRGQGIGKQLVERTFEHLAAAGHEAVAHCGFIRAVARRSDRWRDTIGVP